MSLNSGHINLNINSVEILLEPVKEIIANNRRRGVAARFTLTNPTSRTQCETEYLFLKKQATLIQMELDKIISAYRAVKRTPLESVYSLAGVHTNYSRAQFALRVPTNSRELELMNTLKDVKKQLPQYESILVSDRRTGGKRKQKRTKKARKHCHHTTRSKN